MLDTYGWALVTRGKVHEGIQMLLKATSMEKDNPEMRYHLAKALQLRPDVREYAEQDEELAPLVDFAG